MKASVPRSILILSADPSVLLPAEQFLCHREWTVFTTTDEKAALTYLVDHRPGFFMISVAHTNRRVRALPRLLQQTYPELCVILFAEHHSIETDQILAAAQTPYQVRSPVTGPGVERACNRFLQVIQRRQDQEQIYLKSLRRQFSADTVGGLTWGGSRPDDLLSKGAKAAIDACVRPTGPVQERLAGPTTNTACIVIESPRFSGYLIAAMAGDRPIQEDFMETIRDRLMQFLRENGEPVKEEASFTMKVREVEFESWALDYAEFLKKTVHEGHELALAFFPVEDVMPEIGRTNDEHMCSVQLADLIADEPVDFDLYLFLPANRRYLMYTPAESVLAPEQKRRLQRAGVKELHLREEDLAKFKRYRARHQIEALIHEFQERQKTF